MQQPQEIARTFSKEIINKLNNGNYEAWRFKIELLLIKEGLWNIVRKETPIQLDDT